MELSNLSGLSGTEAAVPVSPMKVTLKLPQQAGVIQSSQAQVTLEVLDATGLQGNRMIIYEAGESLGPPTILGEFMNLLNKSGRTQGS